MNLDVVMLQCGLSDLTVRCVESIHATSDARIILVDNGSPEPDVQAAACALAERDILITNNRNRGFAPAVNQGIERSDADYVCIQNNDTVMYEHGYERMVSHLEADGKLGLVGPLTDHADSVQRVGGPDDVGTGCFYASGLVAFFCTVIPRRVIDHVGLLSEEYGLGYGEDDDYCIRLRRAGYQLGVARDVFVKHDHHITYRHLIGDEGIDQLGREGLEMLREKYGAVA